jgi:hypothetical protein
MRLKCRWHDDDDCRICHPGPGDFLGQSSGIGNVVKASIHEACGHLVHAHGAEGCRAKDCACTFSSLVLK